LSRDQGALVGGAQLFDRMLALERRAAIVRAFLVQQLHRQAAARVFRALAGVVRRQARADIGGHAGVERVVRAQQDIDVPGIFHQGLM